MEYKDPAKWRIQHNKLQGDIILASVLTKVAGIKISMAPLAVQQLQSKRRSTDLDSIQEAHNF